MSTKNTDKITPGPWHVRSAQNDEGYGLLICDEDQTVLSRMDTWLGKTPEAAMEANARLIAAAPELLEAAELCIALCKEIGATETNAYAQARAALAKATGGT